MLKFSLLFCLYMFLGSVYTVMFYKLRGQKDVDVGVFYATTVFWPLHLYFSVYEYITHLLGIKIK